MIGFHCKEISNPPNLGTRFRIAREQLGVSLREASLAIKISSRYLQALENGCFSSLPGDIYAKSFIKSYAEYLRLDPKDFLTAYQTENNLQKNASEQVTADQHKPVERIAFSHLIVTPKIMKNLGVVLLALICLVYLGVKVKGIVTPPALTLNSPADNYVTEQKFIEVSGQVEKNTILQINGQQVFVADGGEFKETIDLQVGNNVIEVKAKKRHSQETKHYRRVVLLELDTTTLISPENNGSPAM